jgi:hypothetical protein
MPVATWGGLNTGQEFDRASRPGISGPREDGKSGGEGHDIGLSRGEFR